MDFTLIRSHLYFELFASLVSFSHCWNTTEKNTGALVASFVCNWFTGEDFRLYCWPESPSAMSLQCFSGTAPFLFSKLLCSICQGIAFGSIFNFILSPWVRSWLCCQLPLLKHSTPHYSWSCALQMQLSLTMLARHKLIPAYPQVSGKPPTK